MLSTREFQNFTDDVPNVSDFETYDRDGDGVITETEFEARLFVDLDRDDSGSLERDEWGG